MNPSDDWFEPTLRLRTWDSATGANVNPIAAVEDATARGASNANSAQSCATPIW
ncbi:MAG: hypothetical protein ACLQAT_31975 [Candidatus Binataceae bacterium]